MVMPKGGSGFRSAASGVASSMTARGGSGGRGGGGYLDNADKIKQDIERLYKSLYRTNGVRFERDANGNVTRVQMTSNAKASIDAVANLMSQNTVEYDREAQERYKDLMKRFNTKTPVFIRLEDSKKTAAEQVQAGNFKIRTAIKNEYRVNGRRVKGDTFRQNTIRERYEQVMGSAAVAEVESSRGSGGATDATFLNAANRAIDSARSAIYTRRNDNSYSRDYFSTLVRRYADVSRNAESRRRR